MEFHVSADQKFLDDNAKQQGVVVLPSGLQYKVEVAGKGKKPKATDTVVVHYEGRLIDGKVFDSSYERGQTISFPLDGVIPGWTEGLQHMGEGAKHELYIPYQLAYGEAGIPGTIPRKATLVFVVELVKVR
jgi:FKBP-type peptidyl-prolyl cis-trans isomerase